ncbi:MAG: T9SS type A sorting domain-containing protein [Chitinophagaceae bacterium]|nr:T9SS type A sorting domain-containing protein [Chitinophagaceae bacterium]
MPLLSEIPVTTEDPVWLEPKLYPNPATTELKLDLAYESRWVGEKIFVTNMMGQGVLNLSIMSKNQSIDIKNLQSGTYFIAAKRSDGVSMKLKFVKL